MANPQEWRRHVHQPANFTTYYGRTLRRQLRRYVNNSRKIYSAFPKAVAFLFEKNATFPIIVAFISKMAYFKNRPFFKNSPISKIGLFQKYVFFNWHISKIGIFQKLTYFKNWPILKICLFQKSGSFYKLSYLKIGIFQKT